LAPQLLRVQRAAKTPRRSPASTTDRGSGVGRIALDALCAEAERLGFVKLVSRIFPENVTSLALHRIVGFREVGI
jgi:L-amino acid N-acyltransferase YncA